jgi:hypothetical protein
MAKARVSPLRGSHPLLTMFPKHITGCSNHDTAMHKGCCHNIVHVWCFVKTGVSDSPTRMQRLHVFGRFAAFL